MFFSILCLARSVNVRLPRGENAPWQEASRVQGAAQSRFPRLQPARCSMKIAILKERRPHETRVAATPETVKKLKALGAEEIVIEAGAGVAAAYTDAAYAEAGATIVPDAASAAAAADIVFKIQRPMAAADGVDSRFAAPGPGADVASGRAHQCRIWCRRWRRRA